MKIMVISTLAICALFLLAACTPSEKAEPIVRMVEVKVPVIQGRTPPESLKRTPITMPTFVLPTDKAATVALTAEGEDALKAYIDDRETRLSIWEQAGF